MRTDLRCARYCKRVEHVCEDKLMRLCRFVAKATCPNLSRQWHHLEKERWVTLSHFCHVFPQHRVPPVYVGHGRLERLNLAFGSHSHLAAITKRVACWLINIRSHE